MEPEEIWNQYKKDWAEGKIPVMDPATFSLLFARYPMREEVLEVIRSSSCARQTLDKVTQGFPVDIIRGLDYPSLFRVWSEVRGQDSVDDLMTFPREHISGVAERASFVGSLVTNVVRHSGRAWVRNRFQRWWREAEFLEEEKEAFLGGLINGNVLNWSSLNALGVDAVEITTTLLRRGEIEPRWIEGIDTAVTLQGTRQGDQWRARIAALLNPVTLPVDVRDSCLRPNELTQLAGQLTLAPKNTLFNRALRHLKEVGARHEHEIVVSLRELDDYLLHQATKNEIKTPHLRFPLIRFLHLRLLLETPSLSSSLAHPEEFLVPEVLTYTLGNDHVSYTPELRVFRDLDRRWRARWAESAGEATSVMFLESTVDLDLTTLARIPETSEQTPDFHVRTINGEPIVFESKGATAWDGHLKQRRTALGQLLKRGSKSGGITWAGSGRAFALSLFAARQGDPKSSLFHVDDPPFPFADLFHEGWEEQARKMHFSAVLEAAQLYETAENVRLRRFTEVTGEQPQTFIIGDTKDRFPNFVGKFLPIQDIARRFQHPDMEAVEKLRIFVGVHEQILDDLRKNKLPGELGTGAPSDTPDEEPALVPPWGVLPALESGLPARGVFSSLPDGSFMAVEIQ